MEGIFKKLLLILIVLLFSQGCKTFNNSSKKVNRRRVPPRIQSSNLNEKESDISYYKQRSPGAARITQPGVLRPALSSQMVDAKILREKEDRRSSGSLWSENSPQNFMFGNSKELKIGDIVYINLKEDIRAMLARNRKVSRSSVFSAPRKPAARRVRGRPQRKPAAAAAVPPKQPNPALTAKPQKPKAKKRVSKNIYIAARIIDKISDEMFLIEGHKLVDVNRTIRQILVSGYINKEDINSRDEVDSRKMADLSIDYAVVSKQ